MAEITTLKINSEENLMDIRTSLRIATKKMGYHKIDQVRIITACSELARNIYEYAGQVSFTLGIINRGSLTGLKIIAKDNGQGIENLDEILKDTYQSSTELGIGIRGAKALMDEFEIDTKKDKGTKITMVKWLTNEETFLKREVILKTKDENESRLKPSRNLLFDELQAQNRELAEVLQQLLQSKNDVKKLNNELIETNQGIIALHSEVSHKNEQLIDLNTALKEVNNKLLELDQLKSTFLANMSHEIRTPMNGILGFTALLKVPGLTGEKQQKYIKIIEKSGDRMLNIVNDIVDISKIEAGLMKVYIKETHINELLENTYNFFKPETEAKGIQLYLKKILPKKEAIIKTDTEKINAILINLVKNAIKFTNKGEIEFGVGFVSSTTGQDELKFFIKDTGIGIPKNRQKAIFERFIQADIADKMATQGAGLGLSISKAYVEMLGGKIWVESEEDIGSTFYFTIPCNREMDEKDAIQKDTVIDNIDNTVQNLKILIAEDDETSETLLSLILEAFSSEIFIAKNGIEAVKICRNNTDLDLIMMDIQMPGLNGYEATKQIREFNKEVIIIAQTAYGFSVDKEKAINAGCNDYIAKPIKIDELTALIQKYFNN